MKTKLSKLLLLLIISSMAFSQDGAIQPVDAIKYVGEVKTVYGKVASSKYAYRSKGQPTFLNLDKPYPHQIFTILIWGSDRQKFPGAPEKIYADKTISVTGLLAIYKSVPEIIVRDPSQIKVVEEDGN